MPLFDYEGRDKTGKLLTGTGTAQSIDGMGSQLLQEGITPIHIKRKKQHFSWLKTFSIARKGNQVSHTELAFFTRQMYTLTKTGVPIVSAIKHLAENSRSKELARVLQGVSEYLESGQSVANAMEHYPEVFSPLMIGMVRVGEGSGRLDEIFLRLTEYLELEGSTIKRAKSAVRYPVFVMIAIVLGVVIINLFVIPIFARVYQKANIPLPKMTLVLIAISNFITHYWFYILIFIGFLISWLFYYLKTPQGTFAWDKYQLKIPALGILLKRIILLRFAQTFAISANAGIPIIEGLSIVAKAVNNTYARQEIELMQAAIQRGKSIVQAAYECQLFTPVELQMLAVTEETGELGAMLTEIAHYYEREVDYDLKKLTDLIEPVLLIAIAIMVLLLALAVYLPIWNMVKLAHH